MEKSYGEIKLKGSSSRWGLKDWYNEQVHAISGKRDSSSFRGHPGTTLHHHQSSLYCNSVYSLWATNAWLALNSLSFFFSWLCCVDRPIPLGHLYSCLFLASALPHLGPFHNDGLCCLCLKVLCFYLQSCKEQNSTSLRNISSEISSWKTRTLLVALCSGVHKLPYAAFQLLSLSLFFGDCCEDYWRFAKLKTFCFKIVV